MKLKTTIAAISFAIMSLTMTSLNAQDNLRNVFQAKFLGYGPYSGIGLGFAYERLLTDRHRISLFGERQNKFVWSVGLGYKYKVLEYKNFELLAGMNVGHIAFDYKGIDPRLSKGSSFLVSPNLEVRYNIKKRFQLLLNVSETTYLNQSWKNYFDTKISIGAGIKF